jgi:phage shock protein PspC (stress-responsive transcriptional regulator)
MTDRDPTHPPAGADAPSATPNAGPSAAEPPAAALPRWARDTEHGLVGGVAAGLAGALAVDVAIVRIAFVVTGLLHGGGVLAYLAAWLALPSLRDARTGARPRWLRERQAAGILVAAAAVLVLATPFDIGSNILLPLLLIGVAVALWRSSPLHRPHPPMWERPAAGSPESPAGPPLERFAPAVPRAASEPPSYLARATVGVAVLAEGIALLLDRAHVWTLTSGRAASLALLVLGAGLVAGTVVGRARWLALPALLLVPLTVGLVTLDRMGLDAFAPVGVWRVTPDTAAQIPPVTRRGLSDARLDLSAVDLAGATKSATVETAVGSVQVWVAPDVTVTVDADVAAGSIDLGTATGCCSRTSIVGQSFGVDRHLVATLPGTAAAGTLHLRLRTGMGQVEVMRGRPDVIPPELVPPTPPAVPSPSRGA